MFERGKESLETFCRATFPFNARSNDKMQIKKIIAYAMSGLHWNYICVPNWYGNGQMWCDGVDRKRVCRIYLFFVCPFSCQSLLRVRLLVIQYIQLCRLWSCTYANTRTRAPTFFHVMLSHHFICFGYSFLHWHFRSPYSLHAIQSWKALFIY